MVPVTLALVVGASVVKSVPLVVPGSVARLYQLSLTQIELGTAIGR